MTGRPPPLTEEQKQLRLARIQQDHDAFISSIATMQSLPRLQSTIAGAGGKTNVIARMAQERDAVRIERLQRGVAESQQDEAARKEVLAKAQRLEAVQSKKRKQRAAKKQRQKERASRQSDGESEGSESESDETGVNNNKARRVDHGDGEDVAS